MPAATRPGTVIASLAVVALMLTGCITVTVKAPEPTPKAHAPAAAPEVDDSAALEELMGAVGNLYDHIERQTEQTCDTANEASMMTATFTLEDAALVLNNKKYLASQDWGKPLPTPGARADQ